MKLLLQMLGASVLIAACSNLESPTVDAVVTHNVRYDAEGADAVALVQWASDPNNAMPALALRILPTDRYEWWSERWGPLTVQGARSLVFDVRVPSDDSHSAGPAEVCPPGDAPFIRCLNGHARLVLERDAWSFGLRNPEQGAEVTARNEQLPHSQRALQHRARFWVRLQPDGKQDFIGWDCQDSRPPPQLLPEGTVPDPRLGCVDPDRGSWWQRLRSAGPRYQQHDAHWECQYEYCRLSFIYREREATLHFEKFEATGAVEPADPWIKMRLLLNAWAMLERQRADALEPRPVSAEIAEARLQARVCTSVTSEARRWVDKPGSLPDDVSRTWQGREIPCMKAARIATRLPAELADESERMLGQINESLAAVDDLYSQQRNILDNRLRLIQLLKAEEQSQRWMAAVLGGLRALETGGYADQNAPEKRAVLERAWRQIQTAESPPSLEQARALTQVLLYVYINQRDEVAPVLLREQWVRFLEKHGGGAAEQFTAFRELMETQWRQNNFTALKDTSDRLRVAYLVRPPSPPAVELPAGAAVQNDPVSDAAYYAVFAYRNYALHESARELVSEDMLALVERMELDLGVRNPYARAARAHLKEVQTGVLLPFGTPYGAGYLYRWDP